MKLLSKLFRWVMVALVLLLPADGAVAYTVTAAPPSQFLSVPILLYHEINESGEGESSIAADTFLAHLDALQEAGYQTVSFQQVVDYVLHDGTLPEKPLLITFDDGYISNYLIAYPALAQRDMVATIFPIGISIGEETYRYSDIPITPHFSFEQAKEMIDSGVISVQTHTYDMHHYLPIHSVQGRRGVLPLEVETDYAYRQTLYQDFLHAITDIERYTGQDVFVLSYPYGMSTPTSEAVASELGIQVTLSTQKGMAQLVRGDESCLRRMRRYSIDDCTPEELLTLIAPKTPLSPDP